MDSFRYIVAGFLILLVIYIPQLFYPPITSDTPSRISLDLSTQDTPARIKSSSTQRTTDVVSSQNNSIQSSNVETNLYSLRFSNISGGSLERFSLNERHENQLKHLGGYVDKIYNASSPTEFLNTSSPCVPCFGFNDSNNQELVLLNKPFKFIAPVKEGLFIEENQKVSVVSEYTYKHSMSEFVTITKETIFDGSSFEIEHVFSIEDPFGLVQNPQIIWDAPLSPTEKNLNEDRQYSSAIINQGGAIANYGVGAQIDDSLDPAYLPGTTNWFAIRNKYFIASLIFKNPFDFARVEAKNTFFVDNETYPWFRLAAGSLGGGAEASRLSCNMYIGPLDIDHVRKTDTNLEESMNFGWKILHPISKGILWLLKKAYLLIPNYGFILIGFALLIRIITGPLTRKSHESSKKMSEIQPKLKKIQEKYKNDPQKLNSEMMALYKESGVNPLGGCLPLLLQMPLLYSLFIVFRSTIEFRGQPFILWISDLSKPDFVLSLPFYIPLYGDAVAVLPILMGITLILTMQMSASKMDPAQKPIMYIMPIFFTLIFNTFPSGLNLYYTCYNVLNYLQQKSINK